MEDDRGRHISQNREYTFTWMKTRPDPTIEQHSELSACLRLINLSIRRDILEYEEGGEAAHRHVYVLEVESRKLRLEC